MTTSNIPPKNCGHYVPEPLRIDIDVSLALKRIHKATLITGAMASLSSLNRKLSDLKDDDEHKDAVEWYGGYYSGGIETAIRFLLEAAEDELSGSHDRLAPHAVLGTTDAGLQS